MTRYSKRISENIEKKKKQQQEEEKPAQKPSRDIFLLLLIIVNFVLLVAGWQYLEILDRAVYILMEIALCSIYTQRHRKLSPKNNTLLKYIGIASMAIAFILFLVNCYIKYAS